MHKDDRCFSFVLKEFSSAENNKAIDIDYDVECLTQNDIKKLIEYIFILIKKTKNVELIDLMYTYNFAREFIVNRDYPKCSIEALFQNLFLSVRTELYLL